MRINFWKIGNCEYEVHNFLYLHEIRQPQLRQDPQYYLHLLLTNGLPCHISCWGILSATEFSIFEKAFHLCYELNHTYQVGGSMKVKIYYWVSQISHIYPQSDIHQYKITSIVLQGIIPSIILCHSFCRHFNCPI